MNLRKVNISERNPPKEGIYNTSRGPLSYNKTFGWITMQNYTTPDPEYWFEEIIDPPSQMEADKAELLEALKKVIYIQDKYFGEQEIHSRLRALCVQIESLIQKNEAMKDKTKVSLSKGSEEDPETLNVVEYPDNGAHSFTEAPNPWLFTGEGEKRYSVNREFIIEAHLYSPSSRQRVIEKQFPELFENK